MTNKDRFTEKPDHNVTGGVRSRRKSFKNELMALPSTVRGSIWRPRTLSARTQRRSLGGVRVAGPSEHLSGHQLVRCKCLLMTQSGH
jgi:hypothetical protein